MSLVGAGPSRTIVTGNDSRVIDPDVNMVGGVTNTISGVSISGVTITGGKHDT